MEFFRPPAAAFSCLLLSAVLFGCGSPQNDQKVDTNPAAVKLVTLDPGHFHAALVQKTMYPDIDSTVYVYAPEGAEVKAHLALIDQYNQRAENPAHWKEEVYTGKDYFQKMLDEKKGNVVVLAGNNQLKTDYIQKAVAAGMNVLADKPMVITSSKFNELLQAFDEADKKKVLLYDIMTERSEITNILQKELMEFPAVFGTLQQGTTADPAAKLESVHYFYKFVSGKALTRPDWFFDPAQQGDAITDVGTHLADLVQWECFPGQALDYKKDIEVLSSKTWPTAVTLSQFSAITKKDAFPSFLQQYVVKDSVLQTHANGEINYTIKGIHAKIIARWEYQAKEGGDTHSSIFRGTKASLVISQGKEDNFQPSLYIIPLKTTDTAGYANAVREAVNKLAEKYPGVHAEPLAGGWKMVIPDSFKIGHEAHFGQVMERYLSYLKEGKLPAWEVPNMIAKYYTTTKGLELSGK